jgi:hypothetical protein
LYFVKLDASFRALARALFIPQIIKYRVSLQWTFAKKEKNPPGESSTVVRRT